MDDLYAHGPGAGGALLVDEDDEGLNVEDGLVQQPRGSPLQYTHCPLEGAQGYYEGQNSNAENYDPMLALAWAHGSGESMPTGELHLQNMLNSDIEPTYSLKEVEGLDNYGARAIIYLEMRINFSNALGHLREARDIFPDDDLLQLGDFQVLKALRQHPPVRPTEEKKDNRGFFEKLFVTKKKEPGEKKEGADKKEIPDKSKKKSKECLSADDAPEDEETDANADANVEGEATDEIAGESKPAPKPEKAKKEKFSLLSVFGASAKRKDLEIDDSIDEMAGQESTDNEGGHKKTTAEKSKKNKDSQGIEETNEQDDAELANRETAEEEAKRTPKAEKVKKEKFSLLSVFGQSKKKDLDAIDILEEPDSTSEAGEKKEERTKNQSKVQAPAEEHAEDGGQDDSAEVNCDHDNEQMTTKVKKEKFSLFSVFSAPKKKDSVKADNPDDAKSPKSKGKEAKKGKQKGAKDGSKLEKSKADDCEKDKGQEESEVVEDVMTREDKKDSRISTSSPIMYQLGSDSDGEGRP